MNSRLPVLLFGLSALGACAGVPHPEANMNATPTLADSHHIAVNQTSARLELPVADGDNALSNDARAQLENFAGGYLRYGHGALVLSTPSGAKNSGSASTVAGDARRALVDAGVSYAAVAGSTYDASGSDNAPIIVSFALMVSMAIMVHSFRQSFERWLDKLLPADLQMRLPPGNDTAAWNEAQQQGIRDLPGVSAVDFRRTRRLYLRADLEPMTLIARDMRRQPPADILPLVGSIAAADTANSVWISEAAQDKLGWRLGDSVELPVGAATHRFRVAGIWRDYARTDGALVIDRARYRQLSDDPASNDASIWLRPGSDPTSLIDTLRRQAGAALEIMTSGEVKQRSLRIFDRAFAVTYGLELLAVLIGLAGISVAASFTAISRRAEFGMLRHIGMLRAQIVRMLAAEGIATALIGALYGLALGMLLSLVLVFVINRQSFNWSIDWSIPAAQLALIAAALVLSAAATAVISGRAALGEDAIRAVREDW